METNLITRVNNVDIVATGNAGKLVPIKPICEALGIAWEPQRKKIQEHYLLSSTATFSMVVAADGKEREMFCLPIELIFGWLFTEDVRTVADADARMDCYYAIWKYLEKEKACLVDKDQQTSELIAGLLEEDEEFLEEYMND